MTSAEPIIPSFATEFDVATYIVQSLGMVSTFKLQMLLFYSQAFSLAWDERALFETDFEAWTAGPKLPSIAACLAGRFRAESNLLAGDPDVLDEDAIDTVDQVIKVFGGKTAQWLSRLIRQSATWDQVLSAASLLESGAKDIQKTRVRAFYYDLDT